MLSVSRSVFYQWFRFLPVWLIVGFFFHACGQMTHSNSLILTLEIPPEEDPGAFWLGVKERTLRLEPQGKEVLVLSWGEKGSKEVNLKAGDRIAFFGPDRDGRVSVEGEARVPEAKEEKVVPIHLRRVL